MARAARAAPGGDAVTAPVFVLGGMYAGVFTATEAAAAGAWLAIFVSVVVYRTVGLRAIWESAVEACSVSAMLFMILAGAPVFGHVMTKLRIPQQIVEAVYSLDRERSEQERREDLAPR